MCIRDRFPYVLKVERQPFGTFTTMLDNHSDNTPIYKVDVQFDATWITQDLDNDTTPTDNVHLAEFGGGLTTNDYVIVDRDPANPSVGEVIGVQTLNALVEQKFRVSNCDTPDVDVFIVNSVSGDVYIGGDTIMNGGLRLDGGCAVESEERLVGGLSIVGDLVPTVDNPTSVDVIQDIADTSNLKIGDIVRLASFAEGNPVQSYVDTRITEIETNSINSNLKKG